MKRLWAAIAAMILAASGMSAAAQDGGGAPVFKPEEIEQLVAPIALYPDGLVAQILMASTYPLEVVEAARWQKANSGLKGQALEEALQKQDWDPSVKSLTAFPQVLTMMDQKLDMTQKLGDAFLAQQKDVMDAVQRLRAKAQAAGNLKSGKEQTVSTTQEGGTTIIQIEPAQTEVVYVPTYDPVVVYGTWPYPAYPPYYYYPPGYVPGAAFWGFTAGVIAGAIWSDCDWGHGDIDVDIDNNFNRNTNIDRDKIKNNFKDGKWQHNPEHRKGAQYRDKRSQEKFGRGQARDRASRDAFRGRAEEGRRDISRGDADRFRGDSHGDRGGAGDRGGLGDRAGDRGGIGDRSASRSGGDAFQGMGRGGETRSFSNRGSTSRGGFGGGGRGGGGRRR